MKFMASVASGSVCFVLCPQKAVGNKRFISRVATVMALRWSEQTRCCFFLSLSLFFPSLMLLQCASAADRATAAVPCGGVTPW